MIHVARASYQYCIESPGFVAEKCSIGDFDSAYAELPDDICAIDDTCPPHTKCTPCSECAVVNWVTRAVSQGQLYSPAERIYQSLGNLPGSDKAFNCTRLDGEGQTPCDCPATTPCTGDHELCKVISCVQNASCQCRTDKIRLGIYVQVRPDFGLTNPVLISYHACIFKHPPAVRPMRHLLSTDTAEFSENNASITFHDPVFLFHQSGIFIARQDGLEIIHNVLDSGNSQYVIPSAFRYSAGTLSFKFVAPTGNVLTGTVQVRSTTHCDRINCFFCIKMMRNVGCLPPMLQYFIVGLMIIITGLALIYLRATV